MSEQLEWIEAAAKTPHVQVLCGTRGLSVQCTSYGDIRQRIMSASLLIDWHELKACRINPFPTMIDRLQEKLKSARREGS